MPKKMVFFDIDGTLVDADKILQQSTKDAITELQDQNIDVVLATGRPPFMFEEIREELNVDSYVSYSGQYVVYEDEVIHANPICDQEVNRLYEVAKENAYPMIFMSEKEMRATVADHPFIYEGLGRLKFAYPDVDETFSLEETIYQALLFCEQGEEEPIACPNGVSKFLRWHKYTCDVLPGDGHKAVGIEKMLDASGVRHENTFAFGDGPNDVEMVEAVAYGVAMGNAVPEVKNVADHVTDHVADNGLIKGLRHLELIS